MSFFFLFRTPDSVVENNDLPNYGLISLDSQIRKRRTKVRKALKKIQAKAEEKQDLSTQDVEPIVYALTESFGKKLVRQQLRKQIEDTDLQLKVLELIRLRMDLSAKREAERRFKEEQDESWRLMVYDFISKEEQKRLLQQMDEELFMLIC